GVTDVRGAAVEAAHGGVRGGPDDAALRREDDLVASALEGTTEELLVGERAVHVRGVEQGHAELDGAVKGGDGLGLVARAVELAHAHAAEAEGGDLEGTELARVHGGLLGAGG